MSARAKVLFVGAASLATAVGPRNDVTSAANGDDAMRVLEERGPFDVVVAEQPPGGASGIELLTAVLLRSPATGRVLVTSDLPFEAAVRAVNEAQVNRIVSIACTVEDLLQAIEAAREPARSCQASILGMEPLATLGTVTLAAIHETNNLLTPLCGSVEVLRDDADQSLPTDPESLSALAECVERLRAQTRELGRLARLPTLSDAAPDLRDVVRDELHMLSTLGFTKAWTITAELPDVPAQVSVRRSAVERVVLNVLVDAITDSSSSAGSRRLRVRVFSEGDGVVMSVVDEGASATRPEPSPAGSQFARIVAESIARENHATFERSRAAERGAVTTVTWPRASR